MNHFFLENDVGGFRKSCKGVGADGESDSGITDDEGVTHTAEVVGNVAHLNRVKGIRGEDAADLALVTADIVAFIIVFRDIVPLRSAATFGDGEDELVFTIYLNIIYETVGSTCHIPEPSHIEVVKLERLVVSGQSHYKVSGILALLPHFEMCRRRIGTRIAAVAISIPVWKT